MSFLTGIGGLLGGATQEAQQIKKERFDKENADLNLTTSMLQHVIENPNIIDPSIKAHAQNAWRDVVMEHLFPDQFKSDNKNPVRKLVDQFVGQQNTGPAMAQAMQTSMSQPGVGRGNAMTQIGGANPPPSPASSGAQPLPGPPAPQGTPQGAQGASPSPGMLPPSPASALQSIPTEGGYAAPQDIAAYNARMQGQIHNESEMALINQKIQALHGSPAYQAANQQQRMQMDAGVYGTSANMMPMPQMKEFTRFDPKTGKTLRDTYSYGYNPDGSVGLSEKPLKTDELEPTAQERDLYKRALALEQTDAKNKKSPYYGMNAEAITQHLLSQETKLNIQDKESALNARTESSLASAAWRRQLTDNAKEWTPKDKAALAQAGDIIKAAENSANKDYADYQKRGGRRLETGPDGKVKLVQEPPMDINKTKEKYIEDEAKRRGTTTDAIRQILAKAGVSLNTSIAPETAAPTADNSLGLTPPSPSVTNPSYPPAMMIGPQGPVTSDEINSLIEDMKRP